MIDNSADKELSPETVKAIGTIERLLRLAARNPNEHEAAAAAAKAQELMEAYNLDLSTVEENSGEAAKRSDDKFKGGHFEWQRELWEQVAKLHFCLYFNITAIERKRSFKPNGSGTGFKVVVKEKKVPTHRLVGRTVNTRVSKVVAEYLESAIARITAEEIAARFHEQNLAKMQYSKWANSFREGMADRINEKLYERRRQLVREEEQKARDAAKKAAENAMAGVVTSTALTISTLTKQEQEDNMEFLDPGYKERSAKMKAEDAARLQRQAEARRRAEEEYTRWAAENPIEARLQAEKEKAERKEQEKRELRNARRRTGRERYYQGPTYRGDMSAYRAGVEAGERVSIDQQADHRTRAKIG